jgi:hypothetical protein
MYHFRCSIMRKQVALQPNWILRNGPLPRECLTWCPRAWSVSRLICPRCSVPFSYIWLIERQNSSSSDPSRCVKLLSKRSVTHSILAPQNKVVGAFLALQQALTAGGYTADQLLVVGCPTPEQVSVMLSAALASSNLATASTSISPSVKWRLGGRNSYLWLKF